MDNQGEQKRVEELASRIYQSCVSDGVSHKMSPKWTGPCQECFIRSLIDYGNTRYAEGVEASAKVAEDYGGDMWNLYKGAHPYTGKEDGRASDHVQGKSDGAYHVADAIRSLLPSVDPTPAPVSVGGEQPAKSCGNCGKKMKERQKGHCMRMYSESNPDTGIVNCSEWQPAPAKKESKMPLQSLVDIERFHRGDCKPAPAKEEKLSDNPTATNTGKE